jgi:hypothetical protein
MSDFEQKNKNILNRFETQKTGTKVSVYSVKTKCGKNATMISMHGANEEQTKKACLNVFGDNYESSKIRP